MTLHGQCVSGCIEPQGVSIVCPRCGDSTPFRCKQRGCPEAAANLRRVQAWLERRSA